MPVPESERDVQELVARLRGHVHRLGVLLPPGAPVLLTAQRLSSAPVPEGFMPSRVHLRKFAEAVKQLAAEAVPAENTMPARKRTSVLNRNAVRGMVFATALVVLIIAAGVPRT
jgi:hypothetical protein